MILADLTPRHFGHRIAQCRGNHALAAKLIEHQTQHEALAPKESNE